MRGLWKNRRSARLLASASGRAHRPGRVEPLEERRLLFTLTITEDSPIVDPQSGLRQVSDVFGYAIPYVATDAELNDPDTDDQVWDFDQELDPGAVGSGSFFGQGGDQGPFLRITHDFNAATGNFRLAPEDPTDDDPTELLLDINATSAGRTWTFDIRPEETFGSFPLVLTSLSFGVANGRSGDADSLNGADFTLDVTLFDGTIVNFSNLDLDNLITPGVNPGDGTFLLDLDDLDDQPFTEVRFTALAAEDLFIDDITAIFVPGVFSPVVEPRLFGAEIVITGPVGTQVQVFDLYGRDMSSTIIIQTPPQGNVPLIDADDNGVPNFNDGIGRIEVRSADTATEALQGVTVTMLGGTLTLTEEAADDADSIEFFGGLVGNYFRADSFAGLYDQFEEAGFGYTWFFDDSGGLTVAGLPPGPGSVIIGSPIVRDISDADDYLDFDGSGIITGGFNNPDQGIFVDDGSVNAIVIHGVVHGTSRFNGAVGRLNIGYMVGSATVKGDLQYFAGGTDVGLWAPDEDYDPPFAIDAMFKSGGELVVERTLGEFTAAGRSLMDITVLGDLNDPATRPPLGTFSYKEKEFISFVDPAADEGEAAALNAVRTSFSLPGSSLGLFDLRGQAVIYGLGNYRNDSILNAEWVGSLGTGVEITGTLGSADPINADDPADVYAFASDGSTPIVVELAPEDFLAGAAPVARIMDQDGRTLAANQFTERLDQVQFLRFQPDQPGVYFLAISGVGDARASDGLQNRFSYGVVITGMASQSAGLIRTGGGLGASGTAGVPANTFASIAVTRGNVGAIIAGSAIVDGAGAEVSPVATFNNRNTDDDDDDLLMLGGASVTLPGHLYGVLLGSDAGFNPTLASRFSIGGNLGRLVTGLSPVAGGGGFSGAEGDVNFMTIEVGGSVGSLDIRGGIGVDQDEDGRPSRAQGLNLRTGLNPEGPGGDVGFIRVGNHVFAPSFSIETSPSSTVGALLISQDADPTGDDGAVDDDNFGLYDGDPLIRLGQDSDLRFVDIMRADFGQGQNTSFDLRGGAPVLFVDDAGGRVLISAEGAANNRLVGVIRVVPVDDSQGVAIAQLDDLDLTGGVRLRIISQGSSQGGDGPISIGRIIVENADAQSEIDIDGDVEVDVWRIDQIDGDPIERVRNNTPGGDLVAVDLVGVNRFEITDGNLGITQVPEFGPDRIGPFIGVQSGTGTGVLDPVGINPATMYGGWNGGTFRPVTDVNGNPDNGYLDDIGSPLDGYLDGLVVRTGSVTQVTVAGAVGDVILQDPAGELQELIVNSDADAPLGEFHGIVGQVYAFIIDEVDVGMGVAEAALSPFATAGIFAEDEIRFIRVDGRAHEGAQLSGFIIANNVDLSNSGPPGLDGFDEVGGIDSIDLFSANAVNATIATYRLDDFWIAAARIGEGLVIVGDIASIRGDQSSFITSEIITGTIDEFELLGGVWDATVLNALSDVGRVRADEFRNSTATGSFLEFRRNEVQVGENLASLETNGLAGDITDLIVNVLGSITGRIAARDMVRLDLDVDNDANQLTATRNIVGSSLVVGQFQDLEAGGSLRTSELFVSGPLERLEAGDEVFNTFINVSGPQGRIDLVTARTLISGEIISSGPIDRIEVTEGDLAARIETTTNAGTVNELFASRDILSSTDIATGVNSVIAGRHVGSLADPGVFLVRGSLQRLQAGAQLYSDLRVGQAITEVVLGPVANRPGSNLLGQGSIIAAGRIQAVNIVGDFDGSIISYSGGIGAVTITGGSFLAGNSISAFDGDLEAVNVVFGNLYGDIHSDYTIFFITVTATEDGVFGDIGVNPFLSSAIAYDSLRNQLPPGVAASTAIDGPRITAGRNIGGVTAAAGSIFEVFVHAGWAIGTVAAAESIQEDGLSGPGSVVIAARDSIFAVTAGTHIAGATIISGVRSFGLDERPGGLGNNADTTNSGFIETVFAGQSLTNSVITAGQTAGADGAYATGDELNEPGVSYVRNVDATGWVVNASVFSETLAAEADASERATVGGFTALINDPDAARGFTGTELAAGVPFIFSNASGAGTIVFTGPGRVFWDNATSRVIFGLTTLETVIDITASSENATLTDFDIVSRNSASVGLLVVRANLEGDSDIYVDAFAEQIITGHYRGTGSLKIGQHLTTLITGDFDAALFTAKNAAFVTFSGNLGDLTLADPDPGVAQATRIDIFSSGFFSVGGGLRATVNTDRTITNLTVAGAVDNARIRAGTAIANFTASRLFESRLSANDFLDFVTINGDVIDSQILIGGDLGDNADFDTAGAANPFDTDRASSGVAQAVTIAGRLERSDIAAGGLRGPDGFFGTGDDSLTSGRAFLGPVTIGGQFLGSNRDTESYRVFSTGALGTITAGGAPARPDRNLEAERVDIDPLPIRVTSLTVSEASGVYTARLNFNQPMDASTFDIGLVVAEARGAGEAPISLINGVDYFLDYLDDDNALLIRFARDVTEQDLPQLAGRPGPGVYRFSLDADIVRAQTSFARLDGDSDGFPTTGDDYSQDTIVGDAGDRLTPTTVTVTSTTQSITADYYGPASLDTVLDNNFTPDGLPDANQTFTVRGSIGDHPDHDTTLFPFRGDLDIYSLTLQAGQILRLGVMQGTASLAGRVLARADGEIIDTLAEDQSLVRLPGQVIEVGDSFLETEAFLITETGLYYIVVGTTDADLATVITGGGVNFVNTAPNIVGGYSFDVRVFDDGDTGFDAPTDAGDGRDLANAPLPSEFAGPDGLLSTADDFTSITRGAFRFTLDLGPDGVVGTGDDLVTGTDGVGAVSTADGTGRRVVTVESAIGDPGFAGLPRDVTPDADVFHLNSGNTIAAGTRMRITVKLNDVGADLGTRNPELPFIDYVGRVQFGIFDTTNATGADDAVLVFAPTDFSPIGGEPGAIAQGDNATYGFDDNGDFFIDFIAPERQDLAGRAASYALYVQGVYNTDYRLEIVTDGTGQFTQRRQNFFIETNGGEIDWLEAANQITRLIGFDAGVLGFEGETASGQDLTQFFVDRIISNLQAVFESTGLDVRISTNPRDFEFEPFSTIFLSSDNSPITGSTTRSFFRFNNGIEQAAFTDEPLGFSEHADPFNADRGDEAVIFLPSFALFEFTPAPEGIEALADALTASVGRRMAELMGLRISSNASQVANVNDITAANSPSLDVSGGQTFGFVDQVRALSFEGDSISDTDFFLGRQNSADLLNLIVQDD